jgi:hypothetical protein
MQGRQQQGQMQVLGLVQGRGSGPGRLSSKSM